MTCLVWATLLDLEHYRSGAILVGIARCIAMGLMWIDLAKGNGQLRETITSVIADGTVHSTVAFLPKRCFLGNGVDVSTCEIARSVLLLLGTPFFAGIVTRYSFRCSIGRKWYHTKFIPFIAPWALVGLLVTVFVIFSIQANQIINTIDNVARVTVPKLRYLTVVWFSVCWYLSIPIRLVNYCIQQQF